MNSLDIFLQLLSATSIINVWGQERGICLTELYNSISIGCDNNAPMPVANNPFIISVVVPGKGPGDQLSKLSF